MVWPTLLLARSQGRLRLTHADASSAPLLDPLYLADPRDLKVLLKAFQKAREVVQAPPLKDQRAHGWIQYIV